MFACVSKIFHPDETAKQLPLWSDDTRVPIVARTARGPAGIAGYCGDSAGILMIDLFRQSATAQAGRAEAEIGRACDAIADAYRFYRTGWEGSAA